MKTLISLILLFSISLIISQVPENELVDNLFENQDYKHRIFSGYLNTEGEGRKLHYVFIESQNNPKNDPVVLWLNGGPGCSSLFGFMEENGPFFPVNFDTFQKNEFSWNKYANMLYIESPAGVGFSYFTDPADKKTDDEKSGKDNRAAVLNFFEKFADYQTNKFYISGESYAGVYIPILADLLLKEKSVNLKGVLIGNGLTDVDTDVEEALIDFAYYHGLYSSETKRKLIKECSAKLRNPFNPKQVTKACNQARREIKNSLEGINIYDVYRECKSSPTPQINEKRVMMKTLKAASDNYKFNVSRLRHSHLSFLDEEDYLSLFNADETEEELGLWPDTECLDEPYTDSFLNRLDIKKKLHVREDIHYHQCTELDYKIGKASLDIYKNSLIASDLKIWFFAGDTDGAVPFNGALKWIKKLNLNITKDKQYRPWYVNQQVAGYVQDYQEGLTYITVRGAGHMVPQWRREEAYTMFNAFIGGQDLPLK